MTEHIGLLNKFVGFFIKFVGRLGAGIKNKETTGLTKHNLTSCFKTSYNLI